MRTLPVLLIAGVLMPACSSARQATPVLTATDLNTKFAANDSTFRDARFSFMNKGENCEYVMPTFQSRQEWEHYRQQLGRRILISTGQSCRRRFS